jgi:hypothetical protein
VSGEEQKNEGTATIAANGRVDRNVRKEIDMAKQCNECLEFEEYEPNKGKHEHNCIKWLCNCGACPHDAEIAAQQSNHTASVHVSSND